MKITSYIGHRVRELWLHMQRWLQRSSLPRVVILPGCTYTMASSRLRAWEVGRKLKEKGWRVTIVPAQLELEQRLRVIRREKPDVLLMQKGRHPYNWPKYYPGIPILFDLDDADYLAPDQTEQIKACCEGSSAVFAGSSIIAEWCQQYNENTQVVWTGAPVVRVTPKTNPKERRPIIAWASSGAEARPSEAELVYDIVTRISDRIPFELWVFGVAPESTLEPMWKKLRAEGVVLRTFPYMSYEKLLALLDQVAVGLNPVDMEVPYNSGKSFGKVLTYLSSWAPVISQDAIENTLFFKNAHNGYLVSSIDEWVEQVEYLLQNPKERERIANQAFLDFQVQLSTDAAAEQAHQMLRRISNAS